MNNYFKVLRPGINSTFQDLGRFGLQHLGIVASGCMDQLSFCNSNKLVDNKISEGALEFAYQGPLLEMNGENALVAISGKVNFNLIKKNGEIIKENLTKVFKFLMEIRLIFQQQLILSMVIFQYLVALKLKRSKVVFLR